MNQRVADAEVTRRRIAAGQTAAPDEYPDHNPLYETTSDRFSERYNPQFRPGAQTAGNQTSTPTNATVAYRTTKRPRPWTDDQKKYREDVTKMRGLERRLPNTISNPTTEKSSYQKSGMLMTGTAYLRAIPSGIAAMSWTSFLYISFQVPIAAVSLGFLGLWAYIENLKAGGETVWEQVLGTALTFGDAVLNYFGMDYLSFQNLFLISWILLMTIGFVMIAGVTLQFLFSGLRPLSGRGAGIKMSLLVAAVVGYMIPGANLLPWIVLYIWAVMVFPR